MSPRAMRMCMAAVLAAAAGMAWPQQAPPSPATLPGVTISGSKATADPVEKSYRRMVRGMDLFERRRALSPQGELRFKLLPRKPGVSLDRLELLVLGKTVETPIPVAPDRTFVLQRDPRAFDENALVTPDRKALTMTWRADIRTPGLPANTRRLGDLRLECEVGMEAGVVSNARTFVGQIANWMTDSPAYCRGNQLYLFFAERPLFNVTLVAGARRESLAINRLYAAASDDANLAADLPYCDCEVMLDRTYFMPLEDASWPDETLVQFDYMEGLP